MAAAVTEVDRWHDSKRVHFIGTIAFSGNYATGGEALSFPTLLKIPNEPISVVVLGQASYIYQWDRTNKKLMVRQSAAAANPLGELPAAAYPAGVTNDIVRVYAIGKLVGS